MARLAIVCLALTLALPAAARACGAGAADSGKGRNLRGALVVGDSTSILAVPHLGRHGLTADARGCRQFGAGLALVAARRRAGSLPRLVVLALGANGDVPRGGLERALRTIGRRRVLALVTPRNRPGSARAMRAFARAHPHRVIVADWLGYSARRGALFAGDGLHVTHGGARVFAAFIARRVAGVVDPPSRGLRISSRRSAGKACGAVTRGRRRLVAHVVRGTARMTCEQARALVRRPPLAGIPGWRWWDWTGTPPGPWQDVLRRADGRVLVATTAAPRGTSR